MRTPWRSLSRGILLGLWLAACTGCKGTGGEGMSEMEQLKYDNALKSLQDIRGEAEAGGSDEDTGYRLRALLRRLSYDFDGEAMDAGARAKCQRLKDQIDAARRDPDAFLRGGGGGGDGTRDAGRSVALVSRRAVKLDTPKRYPVYLFAGETVGLSLNCTGTVTATLYDVGRQTALRHYNVSARLADNITVKAEGIYMLELKAAEPSVQAGIRLTSPGAAAGRRPHVRERLAECGRRAFLAAATDSIVVSKVFREPKKVVLRANLKAMFSGKPRALIAVAVPKGCDAMLYSLRISTNENTVSSDGKFADKLKIASSRVKLFGAPVFEKQSLVSSLINKLLGDTRPPRDEDAFCNLYVITNAAHAKRFQDTSDQSGSFKYDIDQSQIGTQSCNGELKPRGNSTLYLGFENERLRYDNFIWLEVVALTHTTSYLRPVYTTR